MAHVLAKQAAKQGDGRNLSWGCCFFFFFFFFFF